MYRRVPPPRWHLSDALLISTFGVMSFGEDNHRVPHHIVSKV